MSAINVQGFLEEPLDILAGLYFLRYLFLAVSFCLGILFTWRIWRFTISPRLHPEEPPELPYWVPFLGHAKSFLSNQDALLSYGRRYFGNTREPFALTLGQEKLYILTSYTSIVAAYKNNATLDYSPIIQELMRSFGVSEEGISKVFEPSEQFIQKSQAYNPHKKTFFKLKSDFYHTQLHPGPRFEATQESFVRLLDETMRFENIPASVTLQATSGMKSVSLYRLCQEVFVKVGTQVFFGKQLLNIDPDLVHDFIEFDDNNWMVFYNWPQKSVATKPMKRILAVIMTYLDLSKAQRPDSAWLIDRFEDAQAQLETPKEDVAVVLMMLLWVVNTNAYRVAFWMLAHIYHSESLLSTIKEETGRSMKDDGSVDVERLMKDSPKLDSLWLETLRLTDAASAARTVTEPTWIGDKLLKPGHKVMSPYRQIHFDEGIFGNAVDKFDPNRFLLDKTLARHPSYMPFGGGVTKCPGRFVARREVFVFATLVLHRFDSALTDSAEAMPRLELNTPTTGVISPKAGDDLYVRLRYL
ncbi:MAG: hypothetical protein Q9181_004832 [Wetmoreana brouardii]